MEYSSLIVEGVKMPYANLTTELMFDNSLSMLYRKRWFTETTQNT